MEKLPENKIPEVFITEKSKKHESRKSPIPYYIGSLYWTTIENFNFSLGRDRKKISYERRAYESVDDKSLS